MRVTELKHYKMHKLATIIIPSKEIRKLDNSEERLGHTEENPEGREQKGARKAALVRAFVAVVQGNYFFLKHIKQHLKLSKPFGKTEYSNEGSRRAHHRVGCMQLGQMNPEPSVTQRGT